MKKVEKPAETPKNVDKPNAKNVLQRSKEINRPMTASNMS